MRVAVVGAGISGITCAIALRRAGFGVQVVEQAAEFAEVGAGLLLWPNALAALNELGMERPVVASGIGLGSADIRTPSGTSCRLFARADTERYLGGVPVVIHRADLQRILLAAGAGIPISLGARCEAVTQDANRATVHLSDRTTLDADLVVGADGIHSAVRESVTHAPLRYTGMTSWRAVIPASGLIREFWLALGQGKQFLAAPLAGNRTYIAGLLPMAEGGNAALPAIAPTLRHAFTGWHQPIGALIEATPEDKYFRADIYDCPPPSQLSWGRIVLIGDAAHPITPDLGQGGCLAIEDAIVLARCLAGARGISQSLAMFAALRVPRVRRVVIESHWTGWVFAAANPAVVLARSLVLRSIPASMRLRHLARFASRDAFLQEIPGWALSRGK